VAIVLPTRPSAPDHSFEIELDGVLFRLTFLWNSRGEFWSMSIADVNGVQLLDGRRVVVGFPLLARFRDPRLPAGELTAVDIGGTQADPGLDDLGARVRLIYFPLDELPANWRA
jgi:hypothetical protein